MTTRPLRRPRSRAPRVPRCIGGAGSDARKHGGGVWLDGNGLAQVRA